MTGDSRNSLFEMNSISNNVRKALIDLTGYFIYRKRSLPVGVDLQEDLVHKFAIDPKIVFDVGANVGQTALSYAELFEGATIYSFEPFISAFRLLEKNTAHLPNVQSFQVALGNCDQSIEVKIHDETHSDLNSLKPVNENRSAVACSERVKVLTLDSFCAEEGIEEIDLLKIDTEGYELEVLRGAEKFLKTGRVGAILCEIAMAKKNQRNTQLPEVQDFLEPLGYYFVGLYETNVNYFSQGIAYSNALFVVPREAIDYFAAERRNDRT